MALGKDHV